MSEQFFRRSSTRTPAPQRPGDAPQGGDAQRQAQAQQRGDRRHAHPAQLMAGSLVAQRYRLEDLIATGGMSEVWHATDTRLGTEVAVKLLRHDLHGDARFLRRLRMEARNTARLHHPNLVALLDHGETGGIGFLVQEYVHGESLAAVLSRKGSLQVSTVVSVLVSALRGLAAAHDAGVVHRDVKPGNVLLTADGQVKVSDFGISSGSDQPRLTATGMVMGTAEYLSPEQATGKPATPRSDVYAIGVIAHEALAGQRPFTGRTQVEVALAQVEKDPPALPVHVPIPVRTAVLRMLAKDPERRPQDARAAAELLSRAFRDASRSGHPPDVAPPPGTMTSPPPPPTPRAAAPAAPPTRPTGQPVAHDRRTEAKDR